jgi:hypothetical protein
MNRPAAKAIERIFIVGVEFLATLTKIGTAHQSDR